MRASVDSLPRKGVASVELLEAMKHKLEERENAIMDKLENQLDDKRKQERGKTPKQK